MRLFLPGNISHAVYRMLSTLSTCRCASCELRAGAVIFSPGMAGKERVLCTIQVWKRQFASRPGVLMEMQRGVFFGYSRSFSLQKQGVGPLQPCSLLSRVQRLHVQPFLQVPRILCHGRQVMFAGGGDVGEDLEFQMGTGEHEVPALAQLHCDFLLCLGFSKKRFRV